MRSYAVQLFFDKAGEQAISSIWDKVAEASGTVSLSQASVPHVTLLVFLTEPENLAEATACLEAFTKDYRSFPLVFSQAGIFPGREGVVYLSPAMTRYLLFLHRNLFRTFCRFAGEDQAFYYPDKWVPHCSLTLHATAGQMTQALRMLIEEPLKLKLTAVALGIDELPPASTIARFELSKGGRQRTRPGSQAQPADKLVVVPQSIRVDAAVTSVSAGVPEKPEAPAVIISANGDKQASQS